MPGKVTERITVVRNGLIREFVLDIHNKTLIDLATGETTPKTWDNLDFFKEDLRKQGFRFLPFNPDTVIMTPEQREKFRAQYDY